MVFCAYRLLWKWVICAYKPCGRRIFAPIQGCGSRLFPHILRKWILLYQTGIEIISERILKRYDTSTQDDGLQSVTPLTVQLFHIKPYNTCQFQPAYGRGALATSQHTPAEINSPDLPSLSNESQHRRLIASSFWRC